MDAGMVILIGAGVGALAAIPTALLLVALLRSRQAASDGGRPDVRILRPQIELLEAGDEQ